MSYKRIGQIALALALGALPLNADPYEVVLIPVFFESEGAFGSLWRTELWIENRGDAFVDAYYDLFNAPDCRINVPCPYPIPPDTVYQPPLDYFFDDEGRRGLLLYPSVEALDQLTFTLRVSDERNDPTSAGAEIPVVRESEFRNGSVSLIAIPNRPRFRGTLRLYVLTDGVANLDVAVRSIGNDAFFGRGPVIRSLTVETSRDDAGDPGFPLSPSFAEIPDIGNTLFGGEGGQYSLEITAEEPLKVWAFVSITNNETGQVTTVTPQ